MSQNVTAEELIGVPSHSAFHHHYPDGRDYPRDDCPMYHAYTTGKAARVDNEFLWRKDGTGFPVEYGATPIVKDGVVSQPVKVKATQRIRPDTLYMVYGFGHTSRQQRRAFACWRRRRRTHCACHSSRGSFPRPGSSTCTGIPVPCSPA